MEVGLPEHMGYDRGITIFSPDGRLYQVEYARQAVEKATTTVGVTFKEGAILGAIKVSMPLLVPESSRKIYKIDEHIGTAACGLIADSKVLIDFARVEAQKHKMTYNEPIEVKSLVKEISLKKQIYTQYGGTRPFGVSLLLIGMNKTPHLFETDPSGTMREWYAHSLGRGSSVARKILEKEYKQNMSEDSAMKLVVKCLRESEKKLSKDNVEFGIVKNGKFKLFSKDEVGKILRSY